MWGQSVGAGRGVCVLMGFTDKHKERKKAPQQRNQPTLKPGDQSTTTEGQLAKAGGERLPLRSGAQGNRNLALGRRKPRGTFC